MGRNHGIGNARIHIYLEIVLCTVGSAEMEIKLNYFEEYNVKAYEEGEMSRGFHEYPNSRSDRTVRFLVRRHFYPGIYDYTRIIIPPRKAFARSSIQTGKKKRKEGIYD